MTTYKNPQWWTKENDSGWDRVKEAFRRDWDQTKHDLGGKQPDLNQDVGDTIKQATGKEPVPPRGQPVYEKREPAYRFGYGARTYYGKRFPTWNDQLEQELRRDWRGISPEGNWDADVADIRSGWNYKEK
jgi:hypothetical protein